MQLKRERPDSFKRLSCFCLPLPACVPSVVSNSVQPCGLQPTRLLCPRDSPGKNTRGGCHALIQGIFPTQASNPGLPHCRKILFSLRLQISPRIPEWVACLSPGNLPNPGIEPGFPELQADYLPAELPGVLSNASPLLP